MNFPAHLLYTAEHVWVKTMDDGSVLAGITDFAQKELGKVTFVDLPTPGQRVDASREMGAIESAKSVSDLFSPISGVVLLINEKVEEEPVLINQDPYGEGWLVRITPDPGGNLPVFLGADQYTELVAGK